MKFKVARTRFSTAFFVAVEVVFAYELPLNFRMKMALQ